MQRVVETIRNNIWLRVGILGFIVITGATGGLWTLLPQERQEVLTSYVLYFLRNLEFPLLGATILGAATLWVTFSLKPTLWVAMVSFAALEGLFIAISIGWLTIFF